MRLALSTAHLRSDCGLLGLLKLARCSEDISRAGFPLQFYEEGGFVHRIHFNPFFLGCDIEIGLTLSVMGGLLAGKMLTRGDQSGEQAMRNP